MLDSLGPGQRCPGLEEGLAGRKEVLHIPILVLSLKTFTYINQQKEDTENNSMKHKNQFKD
jgi:hypothetical protein